MSEPSEIIETDCRLVRQEMVDYMEADLTPTLRARIEDHLARCPQCTAMYDGARNVMQLVSDERVIELPSGFSQRLYQRLLENKDK